MTVSQVVLCIILAVGVVTIFFLGGTIVGGIHAYNKAYTEADEAHKNLDDAKEQLITSLENKAAAQKELIDSYDKLVKELNTKQESLVSLISTQKDMIKMLEKKLSENV